MIVDLNQHDLINLVRGTTPSYQLINDLQAEGLGQYTGGFKDEWNWNGWELGKMTEQQLVDLYNRIR